MSFLFYGLGISNGKIKMNYIPLDQCELGGIYKINSRNLTIGVYDGAEGFIGIRKKFSEIYLFTEFHHDQGPPCGTVYPLEKIGTLPSHINLDQRERHDKGDSWAKRDGKFVSIIRRDLRPDETPHFNRQGFVDEWADTGERLPQGVWPCLRQNDDLFNFLKEIK